MTIPVSWAINSTTEYNTVKVHVNFTWYETVCSKVFHASHIEFFWETAVLWFQAEKVLDDFETKVCDLLKMSFLIIAALLRFYFYGGSFEWKSTRMSVKIPKRRHGVNF